MKKKTSRHAERTIRDSAERDPGKQGSTWGPVLTDDQRAAIRAYNEHVEKHGVFSDGLRSF